MKTRKSIFFIFLIGTLLLTLLAFFGIHNSLLGINVKGARDMRWGIDIRGGVDAVFSPKDLDREPTDAEMEAARQIIEVRLNQNNILDFEVTTDRTTGEIIVRFPWKSSETNFDPGAAIAELGEMANLTFQDPDGNIIISGKNVAGNVTYGTDTSGTTPSYYVSFDLDAEGEAAFAEATGNLVEQVISIYMDETLTSAPRVEEQITGGRVSITKISTQAEARDLAQKIEAGALPFALTTTNYSTISPTLGSNALEVMVLAGLIAFILICLYMIVYYRLSGVIACIALLLQLSGVLLMLSVPQITVTLPGLAGLILTMGMGVDANIIIAERIREELKSGKALDSAITAGFKRAFSAVLDGNLTTLIVAVIMMIFGSGTLLSFAYTLTFGIIMNFVSGVFANRMMTQSITRFGFFRKSSWFLSKKTMERKLKIRNFYGQGKWYIAISSLVILLGVAMIFVRGVNLDIQFKGGAIFRYTLEDSSAIDPNEAASIASDAMGGRPVTGQVTQDFNTESDRLVLNMAGGDNVSSEDIAAMEAALRETYPDQNLTDAGSNNVSRYYSQKFLRNGILAIALSGLLMVIYVWFSFRRIHGLSAGVMGLLALLHDVLVVFFAFVIFGLPIGDMFIAVVLTILGYSINDTIIIYDRVRENAMFDPAMPPEALMNKSLTQVFTRSFNTSFTLLIAVAVIYVFAAINGLESILTFALPMGIGTISGCYSSLCIAGPMWVAWQKRNKQGALSEKRK